MDNLARIVLDAHFGKLSKLSQDPIIRGIKNSLLCQINFSTNDWSTVDYKAVVFAKGKVSDKTDKSDIFPPLLLDNDNKISIPTAVLEEKYFSISVIGISANETKLVTNWLVFNVENGAITDGSADSIIVQTVYENILQQFDNYYTKEEIDNLNISGGTGTIDKIIFGEEEFEKVGNSYSLSSEKALSALGLSSSDSFVTENDLTGHLKTFALDGGEI